MVSKRKYMKNKHNRSKKHYYDKMTCEITFHGLQEWYKNKLDRKSVV